MSDVDRDQLPTKLAAYLSDEWGESVTIDRIEYVSAGARRINGLFTAKTPSRTYELAATVIPNAEIEINPISVEAAVRTLAEGAGVPVPTIRAVCSDKSVVGGPFFISDFVAGETVPRRLLRLVEEHKNGDTVGAQLGAAFAGLHSLPLSETPEGLPLIEFANPAEASLADAQLIVEELLQPRPAIAYGMRWLEDHLPKAPPKRVILHTDVRTGNIIVGPTGLMAILDWEGARSGGDPMQDLAWPALRMWRFRNDDLEIGGLCDRHVLAEAYEAGGGTFDEESFEWWKVMGTLKWALGLANQAHAHLDGRYVTVVMAASGRRVSELEWDLLMLTKP
jgi:aminoglycoside phosphotransferase (APT) family kinase protein